MRDRRALLRSRAGMVLDWSDVDKAMMSVSVPAPLLAAALLRVRYLIAHPSQEPYLSRATLAHVVHALWFYLGSTFVLAVVWRVLRARKASSSAFVHACLSLLFFTGAASAYVVGHFSTPVLAAAVAGAMAVLLLFELRIAARMLAVGTVMLFAPVVLIAAGVVPYGPLYESMPFISAHPPMNWFVPSAIVGVTVVVGPSAILVLVLTRWRERDEEIHRLAKLDGLTEVANRRYFLERLHDEISRVDRFGSSVGLLLFDLDHFKRVNDRHGHQAGDLVLVEVARRIRDRELRTIDLVGRYGGEEFAVLLPGTDEAGSLVVAERLRESIASLAFDQDGSAIRITASFGVASYPGAGLADLDDLVRRADGALYRSKDEGRNRVSIEPLLERISSEGLSDPQSPSAAS